MIMLTSDATHTHIGHVSYVSYRDAAAITPLTAFVSRPLFWYTKHANMAKRRDRRFLPSELVLSLHSTNILHSFSFSQEGHEHRKQKNQ